MRVSGYQVDPLRLYDGPEFAEYCIAQSAYLPASRDRSACATCALGKLCDAGFQEQVSRVAAGLNPSLTECKTFDPASLEPERLLAGLDDAEAAFARAHIFVS
ncbi:hypothetical protein C8J47_2523 [Sphingomonas sp. PP-F2F-G114-C0414]|uniref:hypothetical protein n=1 Tax=Sphingomonas sp. PP-F2F-G114-C0414 TaxID=2135662 RepID=UPI000EF883FA|nr:hypothetical protein [Sphingomonas sp. PP-F2F-G114-C0414]RMB28310.1 hypothetical protein C8J47_2523 [Sphingomonas sp. PP-F2F-G114-C0414]